MSGKDRWWLGISRYQWFVLVVAWLGWTFDLMDAAIYVLIKKPMLVDLLGGPSGYAQNGLKLEGAIMSIFLVGWAIGGIFFGAMADKIGRTKTMVLTILMYTVFTGLTALCTSWEQVAALRFLAALGIGGEWAAGAALVAETFPDKARAGAAALLQTAAAVGPVLAALLNFVIPAGQWRVMFLAGVIPALLVVFIRWQVKEPEKWRQGSAVTLKIQPVKELFSSPKYSKRALLALLLGIAGITAAGNVSFWLPNLVEFASKGVGLDLLSARKSEATWILHIGTLAGVFLAPWLCVKLGRKPTIFGFLLAGPVTVLLLAVIGRSYAQLLALAPLLSVFTIGIGASYVLYFPELFPTKFRATGAGFAYNVGRVVAAVFPLLGGVLLSSIGIIKGMAAMATIAAAIGLLALPFCPETKGKPLPDE